MNRHAAYVREIPASRCAVLFVHGILGTPRFFDFLLPDIPPDWTVHNVLLSGHGGDVRNFSHASMAAWRRQVASELSALSAAHERVIVCGHSMGTLLAIDAACAHPEQVQGLLLLAVPLRLSLNARSCLRSTALALGMRSAGREEAQALIRAYGVSADRHVWRYAGWAPRYLELFGEIAAVRRMLPDLKTPGVALQSARDEMVSRRALGCLASCPTLQTMLLPDSGHYAYAPADEKRIHQALMALVAQA